MDAIFNAFMKMEPFFERAARNKYINATKDTFITLIYLVVAASILGLTADLFAFFKIWYDAREILMVGVMIIFSSLGILCALVIPHKLAKHLNEEIEGYHKINSGVYTITTVICFCILTDKLTGLFDATSYGVEQITLALITAFAVGAIYKAIIEHCNIPLPKLYPGVDGYIKEVIVILTCVVLAIVINVITLEAMHVTFATLVFRIILPIFNALNSVWGVTFIAGFMALIWFTGVHDSSVVDPFIMGAALYFTAQNFILYHIGANPTGLLTPSTRYFIMALGGTGATLAPCILFRYFSHHEGIRSVGVDSWHAVMHGANEPILYGGNLIRNKNFMIPFIVAPMVNVLIYATFALWIDMGGFVYVLPWLTPAPIGIIICSVLNPLSFLLPPLLIGVDMLIYLPFFRKYDEGYDDKSDKTSADEGNPSHLDALENKKVLILCAGGGTSRIIANTLQTTAANMNINVEFDSTAYGLHSDILSNYDLVLLAPQVYSYLPTLKHECEKQHIACIGLNAEQYMQLLNNPREGFEICSEGLRG